MQKKFSVRAPDSHGLLVVYRGVISYMGDNMYLVTVKLGNDQVKVGNIYGRAWRGIFDKHSPITGKGVGGRKWDSFTTANDGLVELARTMSIYYIELPLIAKLDQLGFPALTRFTQTISRENIEHVIMARLNLMLEAYKSILAADSGDK